MPRNQARRKNKNWGEWEAEEIYEDSLAGNSIGGRVGAGGVPQRDSGNDDDVDNANSRTNNINNGRSHQGRVGTSFQHEDQRGLGLWVQAVSGTVQSMGAAQRALNDLQGMLTSHVDNLGKMEETRNRLKQLEEERRVNKEEVERLETTINTLASMDQKAKASIESQQTAIDKQRQELDQERKKQEKRVSAILAEERLKLSSEISKLLEAQGESHEKRKQELEDEFRKRKDESSKRVAALEAENAKLQITTTEQKRLIKDQVAELDKVKEQCDVLDRAKDSVKKEKRDLEAEIEKIKRDFALSPKSISYFKQRFAEIWNKIEGISFKYFNDIDVEDFESIHTKLVSVDSCFSSVPISDSDDSRKLRLAHAQRVICGAICQYIWKPLGSEFTLSHPKYADLLCKISDEMEKSSTGGRTANVWIALTMRVLQSVPADWLSVASKHTDPPILSRADSVSSKVSLVLSVLLSSSANASLKTDLVELSKLAIDVWNDAHSGELRIIVNPLLERENREAWRSQTTDSAFPSEEHDEANLDIISRTHPRIFTLFPRIIAREEANPGTYDEGPPGGWPRDSEQVPRTIETCIHPGKGLPEWSPLVVRVKEEREEKDRYLKKALETANKEFTHTRRVSGHEKTRSKGSLNVGPPSPTQLWNKEGVMKYPDR